MNIWDIENNFYLKSNVSRLNKALCQYELLKQTSNIPSHIIECGVFKGISFLKK